MGFFKKKYNFCFSFDAVLRIIVIAIAIYAVTEASKPNYLANKVISRGIPKFSKDLYQVI